MAMVSQWWRFGKDQNADKIEKYIYVHMKQICPQKPLVL